MLSAATAKSLQSCPTLCDPIDSSPPGSKVTADGDCSHEIKRCLLLESYDQPRQHIEKQRHYFVNKGLSSKGYGFSSGVMYGCESWTIKKAEYRRIDAFELWC